MVATRTVRVRMSTVQKMGVVVHVALKAAGRA